MNKLLIVLLMPLFGYSQTWQINSFDYSQFMSPGYNVLMPDSSNQVWQVGYSSKFDGVPSTKPALYTDTVLSYPVNMNERVTMVLYDIDPQSGGTPSFSYDIRFWHRFETDSLTDGAYIEISLDSGATWVNAIDYTDSVNWPGFSGYSIDFGTNDYLPSGERIAFTGSGLAMRQNQIYMGLNGAFKTNQGTYFPWEVAPYIRFGFASDSIETNKAGWQIDQVDIYGAVWSGVSSRVIPVFIQPNPSNGLFEIQAQGQANKPYQIFNGQGQIVLKGKMQGDRQRIDLSRFVQGTYFLQFEGSMAIKLIKQ